MNILDLTLAEPAANLALDEALLLEAEEGRAGEVLRLWESPSDAVIVGAGGSVAIDVNETEGVTVLRRASGGGTVVIGPGCLCFTLVLRTDRAPGLDLVQPATRYVLNRTLNALRSLVPEACIEGTSDLTVNGVKFSGSAQQRKRRFFLHHGTLLADFDLERVSKYLKTPERQPDYRRDRQHAEFVMNLPASNLLAGRASDGITPSLARPANKIDDLKQRLIAEWQPEGDYAPVPMERVRELVSEKYSRDEWNRRR